MSPDEKWYRMHLMRRYAVYAASCRHAAREFQRAGLFDLAADRLRAAAGWEYKCRRASKGER